MCGIVGVVNFKSDDFQSNLTFEILLEEFDIKGYKSELTTHIFK